VIVFGRFIVGVRSAVPLVAGVGLYPRTRAFVFGGISIVIWNGLLAIGALSLGHNWSYVAGIVSTYNIVFWIIAGIAAITWGLWKILKKKTAHISK
jgi:membrane protein DedA with SNARE-associated domain